MTCLVALRNTRKGTCIVGADSLVSMGGSLVTALPKKSSKLVSVAGFILGSTGPARIRSILNRIKLKFGADGINPDFNLEDELLGHIIPTIKKIAKSNGILHEKEGMAGLGGQILIAIGDQVCVIGNDFNILPIETEFWAIGSGQPLALGSLASTMGYSDNRQRVLKALEVASMFNPSVGPPFILIETERIKR